MSVDEEEVRAANLAFYRAFESLDLRRMESAWSHEAVVSCVHPGWPLAEGWAAVRESWRVIFENTADIRFDVEDERIDVHGDLAWVVCTEVLRSRTFAGAADGAALSTNVFRREEGRWKVAHHHASPYVPSPRRSSAPTTTPTSSPKKGMVH